MFVVELREALAPLRDNDEIDVIVGAFSEMKPLFRSIFLATSSAADLPVIGFDTAKGLQVFESDMNYFAEEANDLPLGEILFADDRLFVIRPTSSSLAVYCVRRHDRPSSIDAFCAQVTKTARESLDGRRLRGMQFDWRAAEPNSSRGKKPTKLVSQQPSYSDIELQQAKVLAESQARSFVLGLAKVRGRMRAADADKELTTTLSEELQKSGLVTKEYLVSCRQDSHTICTVTDKSHLSQGVLASTRCAVCGRAFSDELMQEIYVLSDQAEKLLQKSHWMTIWITNLLIEGGLTKEKIAWNAAAGEDEIDIIVDLYGTKIFFELKDREFGVGDAYPFLFRLERFGGNHGIVVTTNSVNQEAKKLFSERRHGANVVPVHLVEGDRDIQVQLKARIDKFSWIPAKDVCVEASHPVTIDPRPLVDAWLDRQARLPL